MLRITKIIDIISAIVALSVALLWIAFGIGWIDTQPIRTRAS